MSNFTTQTTTPNLTTIKRGRGRPRKYPIQEAVPQPTAIALAKVQTHEVMFQEAEAYFTQALRNQPFKETTDLTLGKIFTAFGILLAAALMLGSTFLIAISYLF